VTGSRLGRALAVDFEGAYIWQALLPASALRPVHHGVWLLIFEFPIYYICDLVIHPLHLFTQLPVLPDQDVLLHLLWIFLLISPVAHVPNRILEFFLILLLILMVEPLMMRLISLRLWGLLCVVLFEVSKLTRQVFGTTMSALSLP
jgi:hypothetical protein